MPATWLEDEARELARDYETERQMRILRMELAFATRMYEKAELHIGETIRVRIPSRWESR